MMKRNELDEAIYQKYIAPTRRERTRIVGVELEYPIVNLQNEPVDFSVVHQLTNRFTDTFRLTERHYDDEGNVYSAVSPETGDCLSYDCSYNTLELSFGKEEDIGVLDSRFRSYYAFIQDVLSRHGHMITGLGVNPHYRVNRNTPVPNGRYRMLLHHLSSYERYGEALPFHRHPEFGLLACASQVQLDVQEQDLIETLHSFSRLQPFNALLFANSPFAEGGWLLARDHFWRDSMHGYNRRNVDFYPERVRSVDELIAYIADMSIYCVERGEKYINFTPIPLKEYFARDTLTGEYYENGSYRSIAFHPEPGDLQWLRSYKLVDLTYRGTIEHRSVCEQPVSQVFAPAAFHAGLTENLHELSAFLEQDRSLYGHGMDAFALRDALCHAALPAFADRAQVSSALLTLVELAEDGLRQRGFGEEHFLAPLRERAQRLQSPAAELVEGLQQGAPLARYIEKYAELSTKPSPALLGRACSW